MRFAFAVLFSLILTGCATGAIKRKAVLINAGDSKETVMTTLGTPEDRQFKGGREAWQYCETGGVGDYYTVIWFSDGKVSGSSNYSRSDIIGPCSAGFNRVNFEEAPDMTVEVRKR
ncbi:hypothetical protein UFOVP1351_29 [uncultured Caudovirales phage]|uniref:Lipoprotein n=1 Tax=uncultured Caudovirales phage TaxID=2100421 RepID=A0A6J5RS58_9CAUD|nr:hypothetical protein UFOVP1351_29 [uncultured Caudovirales phage]